MVARAGLSVFEREAEEANGVRDMDGGQPVPAISDAGHAPVFSRERMCWAIRPWWRSCTCGSRITITRAPLANTAAAASSVAARGAFSRLA